MRPDKKFIFAGQDDLVLGAKLWTACPIVCEDIAEGVGKTSSRDVDFEILLGELFVGTHTVNITVSYDCGDYDTVLSFNMIKS